MPAIYAVLVLAYLLAPHLAYGADPAAMVRNPLSTSLAEYGLVLGIAIVGGVVGWIQKVKAGELPPWSMAQLIGEMVTSAFAGLLTFWALTAVGLDLNVTAAVTGMSGYAGSKALRLAEQAAQRFAERRLGLKDEQP